MLVVLEMPAHITADKGLQTNVEPAVPGAEAANGHHFSTAQGSSSPAGASFSIVSPIDAK